MAEQRSGGRSGSNRLNVSSFVNELGQRERDREFKDPASAFTKLSELASNKLHRLDSKVESAKSVISKATERKSSGELDEPAFYAETVAARMLISMQKSLRAIYLYAQGTRDIFAVRRVGVVADKLAAVSDDLLMEFHYPRDESLRQALADQNVKMARDAYADAILSLQNVHESLGVKLADFPAPLSP